MNRLFARYSEYYGKLPIDNQSDAQSIIGDYSGTYLGKRIVRILYKSWEMGCFDRWPCDNQERIDWLVDHAIAYIDGQIELGNITRANLPGKEANRNEEALVQVVVSQQRESEVKTKTIDSQQRESEVKTKTIDSQQRESEDKTKLNLILAEENVSLKKRAAALEAEVANQRRMGNVPPVGEQQYGEEERQYGEDPLQVPPEQAPRSPQREPPIAPPQDASPVACAGPVHGVRTPSSVLKHGEFVKIVRSHKTHGGRKGYLDTNAVTPRKNLHRVVFDDGTFRNVTKKSIMLQRAHTLFEHGERVKVNETFTDPSFHNLIGKVDTKESTDELVAVVFEGNIVVFFPKECLDPQDS